MSVHRGEDPDDTDFTARRAGSRIATSNGNGTATKIMVSVLSALLVFLVLYFFQDISGRAREEAARMAVVENKLSQIDVRLAQLQDAADQARQDRVIALELEQIRKQLAARP